MLLLSSIITAQSPADIDGTPGKWVTWLTNPISDIKGKDFENDAPGANGMEDVFASAKDEWDLNLWSWTIAPNSDQTDLTNAGAIIDKDKVLYFMGDRIQTDGNLMIGFWVLLNGSHPNPDGSFSPTHKVGDILILINFVNGAIAEEPVIYVWTVAGLALQPLPAADAGQMANATEQPVPNTSGVPGWTYEQWTYSGKGAPANTYAMNAFFEGYVNLPALEVLTGQTIDLCNATFMMTTRNSPLVSAALADFVWGTFNMTPPAPTAIPNSRCGTGTVSLGASGCNGTLKWYEAATGGSQVATGTPFVTPSLSATRSYWVSCSNGNSESPRTEVVATVINITLSLTQTPVLCVGNIDGTVTATFGGGTSYQAKIDGGAYAPATSPKTFTGLSQGLHTVYVMDNNGCVKTATATVDEAAAITLSLTQTQVSCNGGSDGSITATFGGGTGQLQAKIDGGSYTNTISPKTYEGLSSGSHTVWVIDSQGCVKSSTITVVNPPALTLSLTMTGAPCNGTGMITATFSGGTGTLQAKLDAGGTYTNTTSPKTYTGVISGSHHVWVKDANNCTVNKTITIDQIPCPAEYCSYTQGFYSNQKGKACDLTATPKQGVAFTAALLIKEPLVIGEVNNSVSFLPGDAPLIKALLPGGQQSNVLIGTCVPSVNINCLNLTKQGKISNDLLAQTLTLGLNLRITEELGNVRLEAGKWLTTQDKLYCEKESPAVEMVCSPVYNTVTPTIIDCYEMKVDPYHYFMLPAAVLNYMSANGYSMTVAGLYKLANKALGQTVTLPEGLTLSAIAGAVDKINNAFDGCRILVGNLKEKITCPDQCPGTKSVQIMTGISTVFSVYPNPFNDKVTFEFNSPVDTHALLEIHNLLGQKITTLLDREVDQDVMNRVVYEPVGQARGIYIYRLILGDSVQTGRLIYEK